MPSLMGIDSGLTVTKAVVFDADGTQLAVARRRVPQLMSGPRHVERDMDGLWRATVEAIVEALALSGRQASDVAAIAATAHGDGLYMLDADRRPLGSGILSLDSRAGDIVACWSGETIFDEALALTGQQPHVSAPSALLAWVQEHEPERYSRVAHVMACKDWLRFCLSGIIGTDRTEASTSFTDVRTQNFSLEALRLYGLEDLWNALLPISHSSEIVGQVTAEAAALTGLAEGTPVAAGLHDVTASALGIGAHGGGHAEGVLGIVAGTYSINEVISDAPVMDPRWFCRNAMEPGRWNNMAISPASAANYDWFLDTLCGRDQQAAADAGCSIHQLLAPEINAALHRPSTLVYHPFLFGSPHGNLASANFLGLRGWHDRGDMLKAVLEGIAFNLRTHIKALAEGFAFGEARLTGGISRNPAFVQLFADVLGMPVTVTETDEAAAWGAALCAGAAVGLFATAADDPRYLDAIGTTYDPEPERSAAFDARFTLYSEIAESMKPHWTALEALAPSA